MQMLMRHAYLIAATLFVIFCANILVGKLSVWWFEYQLPLGFSGVVEFLILFVACIFFVAGILQSERLKQKQ